MATPMGFFQSEWGNLSNVTFKTRFRWKFIVPSISADGVSSLPPMKAGRPGLNFREMQAEHLNEVIYFPSKPEWKQIQLSLYDICKEGSPTENPVFTWIRRAYDPKDCSKWFPAIDPVSVKPVALLRLYDGCGNTVEEWTFEHIWPQNTEFGELDMSSSEVLTVDVTLRYDRAYQSYPAPAASIYGISSTEIESCGEPSCDTSEGDTCSTSSMSFAAAPLLAFPVYPGARTPDFVMDW